MAHNADDHCRQTFDELFNREKPPKVAFSELAKQRLQRIQEEASSNHISDKWIRKQDAIVTFLREVVGDATPIADIDYDACMRVQAAVAHVPANRTKLYEGIPLEQAIARAKHEGKPTLLPATQEVYLATFTSILDLAAKKRLISVNPAAGLKPLKRDVVADEDKCHPFTQEQLIQLFHCDYYQQCAASGPVPYRFATDGGWRYWLPLIFLFSGMRPNEICQLHFADIRRTKAGTPYFEVTNATDEKGTPGPKTLKTQTSRRRVPVHTELVRLGIFEFIEDRRAATAEPYIFPLKPDRDGNRAWYPLKRFRESYLPKALTLSPRQSFYSFRHTVRDALRRIHAPADTLQAVCGWSQGRLVSDNYGERSNPDYQHSWVEKIAYLGLDLAHLYIKTSAGGEN